MSNIKTETCPHCGNIVEGKLHRSTASRTTRNVLKKGGMKTVLTAAGSVVPGFGNVAGFVAGSAIDAIWGDKINNLVDNAADTFIEDTLYDFECPKCGHAWTHNESEIPVSEEEAFVEELLSSTENSEDEQERFNSFFDSYSKDEYSNWEVSKLASMFEHEGDICHNSIIKSQYYCVAAVARIEYFIKEWQDDNFYDTYAPQDKSDKIIKDCIVNAKKDINVSTNILPDDNEYLLINGIIGILYDYWEAEYNDGEHFQTTYGNILEECKGSEHFIFNIDWLSSIYKYTFGYVMALCDCSDSQPQITANEQEYIDELKEIIADGEISARERRLLDKIRIKLGISEERAAELEAALSSPSLTAEEQEYLDEYKEIVSEGEISARDQRFLDKLKKANGISEERAMEIEKLAD